MEKISNELKFFLELAKAKTIVARRFDNRLSFHGLGFSDFMILYHLSQAPEEKMRRIDLAEKVGLTASGITRLLLPMEKIGLVKREANSQDARVSFVALASGGKRIFSESLGSVEVLSEDIFKSLGLKDNRELLDILAKLGKLTVY